MLAGYDGYGLCRVFGGRERGEKAGKIIFFPASSRAGEEEGASRSKRHHSMFPLFFFLTVYAKHRFAQNTPFYLQRNGAKMCQIPNKSSILYLFNQVLNCNFNFKN
jgi:hypothetical protein